MNAGTFLHTLIDSGTTLSYEGIYIEQKTKVSPVVTIKKQGETLIFIPGEGTPQNMDIFYELLSLNKRCQLYKHVDNEEIVIGDFKELDNKIIL